MKPYLAVLLLFVFVACSAGEGNDFDTNSNHDTDRDQPVGGDVDGFEVELDNEIDDAESSETLDTDTDRPGTDPCLLAESRLGESVCSTALTTELDFDLLSVTDASNVSISNIAKYFVPASSDAPLPTLLINAQRYPLHYDFLTNVFSEYYAGLTAEQYETMVLDSDHRDYYVGALLRFVEPCGTIRYGFTVEQDLENFDPLSMEQLVFIHDRLEAVLPYTDLMFYPSNSEEEQLASSWLHNELPVYTCDAPVSYESYGRGETYGYIRRFTTLQQFEEAGNMGLIGWQDIIVLDGVPFDLPGVVAGCITGTRQNQLSHLNVRANALHLPNAFVRDSLEAFASLEGSLVHLQITESGYTINTDVTYDDALRFWEDRRPQLENVAIPDAGYTEMPMISELSTGKKTEREQALSRFGGKGTNLAVLYSILGSKHSVDGFLIPFSYYFHFMESNTFTTIVDGNRQTISFADFVRAMTQDDRFLTDPVYRRQKLNDLVYAMRYESSVPSGLILSIAAKTQEVFGNENRMLRFRSSSNLEDSIEFGGAGLYESTSGCVGDSFGGNPNRSACDDLRTSQQNRTRCTSYRLVRLLDAKSF